MRLRYYLYSSHLDDNEEIMYVAHRHPFILMKASIKVFFLAVFAPVLFFYYFPEYYFASVIWFAVGFIGVMYHFVDWYFDAWLITNQGVIDIERNGLFDRNSTRVDYHMIEGMAYTIKGFWNTVLNFGDITIDKLGARTTLVLSEAGNPKRLERTVMRYHEQFVNERSVRDHDALKGMLSEMIAYHVQNKKINDPRK